MVFDNAAECGGKSKLVAKAKRGVTLGFLWRTAAGKNIAYDASGQSLENHSSPGLGKLMCCLMPPTVFGCKKAFFVKGLAVFELEGVKYRYVASGSISADVDLACAEAGLEAA